MELREVIKQRAKEAAQKMEINRLCNSANWKFEHELVVADQFIDQQQAEIDALKAEVAELRRDKARIDAIQQHGGFLVSDYGNDFWYAEHADGENEPTRREGDSARDVIDQLRAALLTPNA